MPLPIVLMTDFGLVDAYVGVMKGRILSISPHIPILDLSHMIPQHNVLIGSVILSDNLTYFPEECIFCCVVDPGVGGKRKAIALKIDSRWFVGPDNGLFSPVLKESGIEAYEITQPELTSNTFHGRDIFAPTAALLAVGQSSGISWSKLDPKNLIENEIPQALKEPGRIRGKILYADHFGNLITNILWDDLEPKSEIYFDGKKIFLYKFYDEMPNNSLCALIGSSGRLEISVKNASAEALIGWSPSSLCHLLATISSTPGS